VSKHLENRTVIGRLVLVLVFWWIFEPARALCAASSQAEAFPPRYTEPEPFSEAITSAERLAAHPRRLLGLIVPHHLLAAELIARGFRELDASTIDKVVILFPDHFKKTHLPFATTTRDFETVFGTVPTQHADAARLLVQADLVQDSELFAEDHGIGAILPFVKHYLPGATIVPIAVSIRSHRADWDRLTALLETLVTPRTLVVQSTDFSHYLPLAEAVQRDQETLNVLASGDLDAAAVLVQPDHTDSRGALYIQMKLQAELFHARPVVIANANSQIYSDVPQRRTTSYMITLFEPDPPHSIGLDDKDSEVYCFAGDTFFGRYVARELADETSARLVRAEMKSFLGGCRLIINLEGVMLPRVPGRLGRTVLGMPDRLTLAWLRALKVAAVGLANNHVRDFGPRAYRRMVLRLRRSGFRVLQAGRVTKVGRLHIVALTDLDNASRRASGVIGWRDLVWLARLSHRRPEVAFMHWGEERKPVPAGRQQLLEDELARAGLTLIVGAHPHQASEGPVLAGQDRTLMAYSLGNYLFDQTERYSSGAILEVRLFRQGTLFSRLFPIPNYFDRLRTSGRAGRDGQARSPAIAGAASAE
jgi:AmmeMemoRadiSam system protein B